MDKLKTVQVLLADEEWGQWSSRQIAKACAVSPSFVDGFRKEVTADDRQSERTYQTRHGTAATMDTSRIGRKSQTTTEVVDTETGEVLEDVEVLRTTETRTQPTRRPGSNGTCTNVSPSMLPDCRVKIPPKEAVKIPGDSLDGVAIA
jgi:phage portal protein BeeE